MLGLVLHVLLEHLETGLHDLLEFLGTLLLLASGWGLAGVGGEEVLEGAHEDVEGVAVSNELVDFLHLGGEEGT